MCRGIFDRETEKDGKQEVLFVDAPVSNDKKREINKLTFSPTLSFINTDLNPAECKQGNASARPSNLHVTLN